jgi:hypothetical protein
VNLDWAAAGPPFSGRNAEKFCSGLCSFFGSLAAGFTGRFQ